MNCPKCGVLILYSSTNTSGLCLRCSKQSTYDKIGERLNPPLSQVTRRIEAVFIGDYPDWPDELDPDAKMEEL